MTGTRQREPRIVMPKITAHANGQDCTIEHPDHCNNRNVVAAHYNWADGGKGVGLKSHDILTAFACDGCHRFVDNAAAAPVEDRKAWWSKGHRRTLYILVRDGVLR